jgi:hypothetical protein
VHPGQNIETDFSVAVSIAASVSSYPFVLKGFYAQHPPKVFELFSLAPHPECTGESEDGPLTGI